jgi:peptidoglycan glycosyltransferase
VDRSIRRLFYFFVALFVSLILMLTYVQVWAAPSLKVNAANTRAVEEEMKIERGLILSADGEELATNRKEGQYYLREYPLGDLVEPWLGYNSLRYGRAGIERVYNEELTGQTGLLGVTGSWSQILGQSQRGADLKLTIDLRVQRAAAKALGNRKGAIVALDPRTGAVLAMVSYPRYDPNELNSVWKDLIDDPGKPLLNRAIQGLYPPGSVFKIIVASAGLQTGTVTPETEFNDTGTVTLGGYEVHNFDDKVYGDHTFAKAFASSINTTFAKVGVELGAETLASYSADFGFGESFPWRLGGAKSSFPDPADMDTAHVAQAAIGQADILSTPMLMALAASAVANEGKIMKPYIVDQILSYNGAIAEKTSPSVWLRPITQATAATMTDLMIRVVKSGTGTAAALPGVQVAGKTGTAEVADAESHAWFAGFAPADNPQVAVVVLVENGGSGGGVAAPIAKQVIAAALGR